ncbi:tartronate semialdehyde reductase [Edaphobacter acidisoli]|uniref:Tartronate semialdehyde reductase n=1 Tax=Edaphobacter acidisoli TaxID=2040573 RepID=A0A916RY50_9BACT|nr:NAD(P)-dependent oxidoreductase [Edaphobacter acidisoli]GGA71960.1 tartronate semialdehyde reductase [Edaphobacter acidisoli]
MASQIGFIGLGIMGRGMVKNLVEKGHSVAVWNRTHERAEALSKELKVAVAKSPRAVAEGREFVLVCVSDTPDVEQVLFGPDGVVEGVSKGTTVIDLSTISPSAARRFAARLAEKGVGFLDAPVSGGSEGAAKGTLSIMAGGPEDEFNRAKPVLEAMGTRITHLGPVGSGQMTKLMNQVLVVVNMLAVGEALLLGRAANLDLRKAVAAVEAGAAGSWMLSQRGTQAIDGYWKPGFTIDLQQKDLRLVLESAEELGVPMMATSIVHQLYNKLQREGKGGLGNHALVQAMEEMAGIRLQKEA